MLRWKEHSPRRSARVLVRWAAAADITSPVDGVVLFTVTSPAIKQGGLLLGIGVL